MAYNKSLQPTTHPGPRLAPRAIDEASRGPWRAAAELNRYTPLPFQSMLLPAVLLAIFAVPGCKKDTPSPLVIDKKPIHVVPAAEQIPIVFKYLANNPDSGVDDKEYEIDTTKSNTINIFVKLNNPDFKVSTYYLVKIFPLSQQYVMQRTFDITIDNARLGAFIDYYNDNKLSYVNRKDFPFLRVKHLLEKLCAYLSVDNASVKYSGFFKGIE